MNAEETFRWFVYLLPWIIAARFFCGWLRERARRMAFEHYEEACEAWEHWKVSHPDMPVSHPSSRKLLLEILWRIPIAKEFNPEFNAKRAERVYKAFLGHS